MSEWKKFPEDKELLYDDGDYLVSWKSKDENYRHTYEEDGKLTIEITNFTTPIRAWWFEQENKFFPLDAIASFPIVVDAFMELPEPPKDI